MKKTVGLVDTVRRKVKSQKSPISNHLHVV